MRRLITLVLVWLCGCAALPPSLPPSAPPRAGQGDGPATTQACRDWFLRVDQAVDAAGVRDAEEARLTEFPYLRTDRFLASFRQAAREDAALRQALFAHWRQSDLAARSAELANLPMTARHTLGVDDPAGNRRQIKHCGDVLAQADLADRERTAAILERLEVADHYSTLRRFLGLYALSSRPFLFGVERWQRDAQAQFGMTHAAPARRYHVAREAAETGTPGFFAGLPRDALGIPQAGAVQWDTLFAHHAPLIEIETRGDFDRFGALGYDGDSLRVDSARPVVYRRIAFTRFAGKTLTQLVYTLWFPERPRQQAFDLLAGSLDGVILRLTLDEDGTPLVLDSIHACGCYHLFFPSARLAARTAPHGNEEWAFVPKPLPLSAPGQRLVVRLASATHYLIDVRLEDDAVGADGAMFARFDWRDESALRSLPLGNPGDDRYRSAYGPDGLIAGSERGERLLFWPMGIVSPGAMRQWGNHATAFVGRRHFDDADLLERRFARR